MYSLNSFLQSKPKQSLKFVFSPQMWGWWGTTRAWSFLVEQNYEGEGEGRLVSVSVRVKIVLRWGTLGTGEWSTRMGLEVPRVRLTWWLTDITVITFSHVKLTAGLWRWRTNNSIFLREIVKLISPSASTGWLFNDSSDSSVRTLRDIWLPFIIATSDHSPPAGRGCGASEALHGAGQQSHWGGRQGGRLLHSYPGLSLSHCHCSPTSVPAGKIKYFQLRSSIIIHCRSSRC